MNQPNKLVFFNETWFYPSLIPHIDDLTISNFLDILDELTKTHPNSNASKFHTLAIHEMIDKRLAIITQFNNLYYEFRCVKMFRTLLFKARVDCLLSRTLEQSPGPTKTRPSLAYANKHPQLFMKYVQKFFRCALRFMDGEVLDRACNSRGVNLV